MSEEKNNKKLEEEATLKEEYTNTTTEESKEIKSEIIKDKVDKVGNDKSKARNIKLIATTAVVGVLCLAIGFTMGKESGRKLPATWKNYSSNKVVATVGDTKITEKDLSYRMEPLFYISGKEELPKDQVKAYESSMIDYITTTEVLYLEGKAEGIKATEEDITTEYGNLIESLTQSYGITEDDLINKFKIPKDVIRTNVEKELIATQYIGDATAVSDKEAKNYYDKNKDEFLKVKASHILIKNIDEEGNAVSDKQKKENKVKAEEILKKAQNGENFVQLAKEYSEDSSAQNGGDLDFFSKGQMVQPFEEAVFSLGNGEIAKELVETEYGYHIIKKTDETYDNLDDVQEELKYNLSYQKQSNLIKDLSEKYNVNIK